MLLGYIYIEKSKFKWALINLKNISNLIKIKKLIKLNYF